LARTWSDRHPHVLRSASRCLVRAILGLRRTPVGWGAVLRPCFCWRAGIQRPGSRCSVSLAATQHCSDSNTSGGFHFHHVSGSSLLGSGTARCSLGPVIPSIGSQGGTSPAISGLSADPGRHRTPSVARVASKRVGQIRPGLTDECHHPWVQITSCCARTRPPPTSRVFRITRPSTRPCWLAPSPGGSFTAAALGGNLSRQVYPRCRREFRGPVSPPLGSGVAPGVSPSCWSAEPGRATS
jgi:hypothetical protein